jgi:hypothetical protein
MTLKVAPSITDTLLEPAFEMYANGAAPAAEASSAIASTPRIIPENHFVPEKRLGSGHLVFMRHQRCRGNAKREST